MPNQERNGRNVAVPDENRQSWRPQDEAVQRNRRSMSGDDDFEEDRSMSRDRFANWDDRRERDERSMERYGQGQSGYAAGRYEEDRSYQSRNQGFPGGHEERPRERGMDERFSQGRGGSNWGERMDYQGRDFNRGYSGSGYGHGDYQGRGQQMGYGQQTGYGRTEGRWGNEGYQRGNYGSPGHWHQEGGMYGHGPGTWGQDPDSNTNYDRQQQYGQGGYGMGAPGSQGRGMYGESMQGGSSYTLMRGGYGHHGQGNSPSQPSPYGPRGSQADWEQRRWGQDTHRGKGPSGYARSDERIREMVCEALTDDHDIDATHIDITVKNGEVVLSGTVDDRRQKRLAEDCVEQVSGVKDVQNQIRIATGDKRGSTKETESSSTMTSTSSSEKRHRA